MSKRVNVEEVMDMYKEYLKDYGFSKKIAGGVVLHFEPVAQTGYYIMTFTAYDEDGKKSDRAMPFDKYIKLVNEIEDLIEPFQETGFTGRLAGWNPTPNLKKFLYTKKVHRVCFLDEDHVLPFVKEYTSKKRVEARLSNYDVEVVVMFGK